MPRITSRHLGAARPLTGSLALALLAGALSAQILPGERSLLLEYDTASIQAGNSSADLDSADLDGDGDLDVISVNGSANSVRLLFNDGTGTFAMQSLFVGDAPSAVAPADLDGDGDVDLVVGSNTQLHVLQNDGAGHFTAATPLAMPSADHGAVDVIAYDVDSDGHLDVLVGIATHLLPSGGFTGGVLVAFGDGTGRLSIASTHELPQSVHRLVAADFDGDGRIDVAELGGYVSASRIDVAFGMGDGTFVNSGTEYNAGSYASGFAQGDWDGDGDIDLANGNKYALPMLINDGTGHFSAGQSLNPGYYTKGIASGDVDRDGDIDLLATSGSSYAMRLYKNDGAGSFTGMANLPTTLQTLSVMLADTNGDGYLDPWSGDYSTGTLTPGASHSVLSTYGQAKPNSLGCLPQLLATGKPTAGGPGLVVQAKSLLIDQPALVLVSLQPGSVPGLGGTLFVLPPWAEVVAATSHGTGDPLVCDGSLSLPVDGSVLGSLGIGTRLFLQVLSVDPGQLLPPRVSLTNGLWFEVSAP